MTVKPVSLPCPQLTRGWWSKFTGQSHSKAKELFFGPKLKKELKFRGQTGVGFVPDNTGYK